MTGGAPAAVAWPWFWKVEGLGNDFVLVDLRSIPDESRGPAVAILTEAAAAMCDRHRGIGADGLLLVLSDPTGVRMEVINHDGSVPEMCGNGLRCVALYVAATAGSGAGPVRVQTRAGERPCTLQSPVGSAGRVRADMGPVRVEDEVRPGSAGGRVFVRVNVGNPHAVYLCGPDEDPEALVRRWGPQVARDPAFPGGANVEFVRPERVTGDGVEARCWVWERGCGITQACGTGACAAGAVLALRYGVPRVCVRLPGGGLDVAFDAQRGRATATGPARLVFRGVLPESVVPPDLAPLR